MVQQKVIKPAMQSEILGVRGWWGHLLCPAIVSSVGPVTIVWEEGGGGGAGRGHAAGDREPSLGKHRSWRFLSQGKLLEQTL